MKNEKRKVQARIISLLLCAVFVLCTNNTPVSANTVQRVETVFNGNVIDKGCTTDGIHYIVYSTPDSQALVSPLLIDTKRKTVTVNFNGNVIPPKTWRLSVVENNITYTGTLVLQDYFYDNLFGHKTTSATYTGTVVATL